MKCPKCNHKALVIETRPGRDQDTYRQHKCPDCGYLFYTAEFEVEPTEDFIDLWRSIVRPHKNKENKK